MKCLNERCGSLNADELNMTLNVSGTVHGLPELAEEVEYDGSTDYAVGMMNTHLPVGTTCQDCGMNVFLSDWTDKIRSTFAINIDMTVEV